MCGFTRKKINISETSFKHTAQCNSFEIIRDKTCYNIVKKYYRYADVCLSSTTNETVQPSFQNLYGFYFVNAKNRKINNSLSYGISSIQRCTAEIGNYDLFCLNTGADGGSTEARRHEIKVMESLFPNPCPYEK